MYIGDIGTAIIVELCEDVSTATSLLLKVEKPDGTRVDWVGSVYLDTKIRYMTLEEDLDQVGSYLIQPYVSMPNWSGHGETVTIRVLDAFM
jgi:hypothetical protein